MTEPAENSMQPAADAPLPSGSSERRAKARAWARKVLSHRPDPAQDAEVRARLGLRSRRGAA